MKKNRIFAAVLAALMIITCFSACGKDDSLSATMNVGTLKGPTGMGMVELFDEEEKGYNMQMFESPDQVTAKLLSGELDVAAVPSNLGAVLYNKTKGDIQVLGVNTGGVLYVVSNVGGTLKSLEDLKGQTLYASGQGGTPEFALKALMAKEGMAEGDINIVWLSSHADVISRFMTEESGYALLPEPHVTVAQSKDVSVSVILDINAMWMAEFGSELPMGILVARKEFAQERANDIAVFLADYAGSVQNVLSSPEDAAEDIAEAGIVASEDIALSALPRCNIMLKTGYEDISAILNGFYETLFGYAPASIGGAMPEEDYYYTKDVEYAYDIAK